MNAQEIKQALIDAMQGAGLFSQLSQQSEVIDISTAGNNLVVPAVNSRKIRIVACALMADGTTTVSFKGGVAGNKSYSGAFPLIANAGFVLPYNPQGWFTLEINSPLMINLGTGSINVDGVIDYVLV